MKKKTKPMDITTKCKRLASLVRKAGKEYDDEACTFQIDYTAFKRALGLARQLDGRKKKTK